MRKLIIKPGRKLKHPILQHDPEFKPKRESSLRHAYSRIDAQEWKRLNELDKAGHEALFRTKTPSKSSLKKVFSKNKFKRGDKKVRRMDFIATNKALDALGLSNKIPEERLARARIHELIQKKMPMALIESEIINVKGVNARYAFLLALTKARSKLEKMVDGNEF